MHPAPIRLIEGTLASQTYSAENIISRNSCTVPSGTSAACEATFKLKLSPGFSVKKGGKFNVKAIDNGGLSNAFELRYFSNLNTYPNTDSDNDGLTNLQEFQYNINPNSNDSDNDGFNDGIEIYLGTAPDVTGDIPPKGITYEYDELGRITKIIRIQ